MIIIRSPRGYSLESHKTLEKVPTPLALPNIPGINVTSRSRKPTSSYILGVPGRPPWWIHRRGSPTPNLNGTSYRVYVPVWAPTADAHPHHVSAPSYLPATTHKRKNRIKNEMEAPKFETYLAEGDWRGARYMFVRA